MTDIDAFFKEIADHKNTFLGRVEDAYWFFKRGVKKVYKSPRLIKWWYQRARYGYSDRDWWNGDWYLCGVIAGIIEKIVNEGHGVANSYADEDKPFDTDVDIMVERRDAEWNKYIAIFREYSKHGPAYDQEWADNFGGVLDKDMQDALQWLSEHFQELWD